MYMATAQAADEPRICRFCLDNRNSNRNPLLTPCECKGSIEFVHLFCLNHWRNQDPQRNGETCLLCFTPYHLPEEYDVEVIPGGKISYYLIDSGFFLNLFLHYIAAIIYFGTYGTLRPDIYYICVQLIYHLFQIGMMYKFFSIRKRVQYIQRWSREGRWLLIPTHFFIGFLAYQQNLWLSLFTSSLYVTAYWQNHIEILLLMNIEHENQTE